MLYLYRITFGTCNDFKCRAFMFPLLDLQPFHWYVQCTKVVASYFGR